MVGTIEPRKNHESVLRAVEMLPVHAPRFVIVGREGWATEHVVPAIRRLEAAGRVIWLRDLADADLPQVYAGARVVLYPSWTEGFGLPVLEGPVAGRR